MKHYMTAYEECLSATSTHHSPWYVVPADDKENARLIVSRIVLDTFEELKCLTRRRAQSGAANCNRSASSSRSEISNGLVLKHQCIPTS